MKELVKIGVFYDGNYFLHVSNFYNYHHDKQARISVGGLHKMVRELVSEREETDEGLCKIVNAHYFRGRLNAAQADEHNRLYAERAFDDILTSSGVVTHYLPIRSGYETHRVEKGIDLWMALEAYDLTMKRGFDVVVLIACDGDYVPLVRKLNSMGVRVMVLAWEFEATMADGRRSVTKVSQDLLDEACYPVQMAEVIDERLAEEDEGIERLFVPKREAGEDEGEAASMEAHGLPHATTEADYSDLPEVDGPIMTLKNGYGFIEREPNNVFFHYTDVEGIDFAELEEGDVVDFFLFAGGGRDGGDVAKRVRLASVGNRSEESPGEVAYDE